MKQTKLNFNMDGFNDLLKTMGKDSVVKVGVLGSGDNREGNYGNADIGATHEFGSISSNIPPRSFLRMPLNLKKKELMKVMQTGAAKKAVNSGNAKALLEIIGIKAEGIIQDAFSSGGFGQWAENKPETVARKGSSAPLIDNAELRGSISSSVVKRSEL